MTTWISLFRACEYFDSEGAFIQILRDREISLRGQFYLDPSFFDFGKPVPTKIDREYLFNCDFNFAENRISAKAFVQTPEWAVNEAQYVSVEVLFRDLMKALEEERSAKSGRPTKNHDIIRELFEIHFEVGEYSIRSIATFVRTRMKEEYPGEVVPSFDTVRRVLRPLYNARVKGVVHNST